MKTSVQAAALVGLALFTLGCATGASSGKAWSRASEDVGTPRGPGFVFPNIEAAAVDALAFAHLTALREGGTRRMRGGTIYAVDGGYTYGEIHKARRSTPNRLTLELRRQDIAHFHTYPKGNATENRLNEVLSPHDRRSVTDVDPYGRPLFVLTPSLRVLGFDGVLGTFEVARLPIEPHSPLFAGN